MTPIIRNPADRKRVRRWFNKEIESIDGQIRGAAYFVVTQVEKSYVASTEMLTAVDIIVSGALRAEKRRDSLIQQRDELCGPTPKARKK